MINYLQHDTIDKKKWDELITTSPNGMIYAFSWWLDIVSPGWEALVEGDYENVMPLTHRSKAGIRYLYQPAFTQQLGVFGKELPGDVKVAQFLLAIPDEFKLVEISLNVKNTNMDTKWEISPSVTHHLPLKGTHAELFKSYSENTRRNIKKAQEEKHEFVSGISADELLRLYRENQAEKHGKLKTNEEIILRKLINKCVENKCGLCVGIKIPGGTSKAFAFFVWSHQQVIFLFSATDLSEQKIRWLPLLIDQCIAHDAGKEIILDFEGSNDPDLARFYKSFGAEEIVYLRIRKNRLPVWLKWLK